jgi:hypothetical protein
LCMLPNTHSFIISVLLFLFYLQLRPSSHTLRPCLVAARDAMPGRFNNARLCQSLRALPCLCYQTLTLSLHSRFLFYLTLPLFLILPCQAESCCLS